MSQANQFCNDTSGRPDFIGIAAVALTAVLHLVLQSRGPNLVFIIAVILFWLAYVLVRAKRHREMFYQWGFRKDNLLQASLIPAAIVASTSLALAAVAITQGTFWFPAHNLVLFLIYPVWGIAQQFIVLGVFARNLQLIPMFNSRPALIVVIVAILFGLVHIPDVAATVATFFLGLISVLLYFRDRNLWPLGIMHGWLGALFYLWVMGRDLWSENLKMF